MEEYAATENDIEKFSKVLADEPVRKYITDDAMVRWHHATVDSLAKGILENSALRWTEDKEKRFLVRDDASSPVGMIGITRDDADKTKGELWYYKT